MKKIYFSLVLCFFVITGLAQKPVNWPAGKVILELQKLKVFGSVLYIAAHPDDENTRLLAYLANEKKMRTGYLSLTRGDGGQNLIGDEMGISLGLIRTQELLSARRIDGAEQFFTRAYDFGYSKTPVETLQKWDHDKILSDVVWVIRKFQPDIIITRFPTTGEGGHGHHTASAILATEAFTAAADSNRFTAQFQYGVKPWQAKRLLWNTFNFGSTNTQREDQFTLDCGGYNPIIGKSYGEIASESRSQHKSQGFGVAAQRGEQLEYFATLAGDKPLQDLMDGVNTFSNRVFTGAYGAAVDQILNEYNPLMPEKSVHKLVDLYALILKQADGNYKSLKLNAVLNLIQACSGLFIEAVSARQLNVPGDSMKLTITLNNRLGIPLENVSARFNDLNFTLPPLEKNVNSSIVKTLFLPLQTQITQPYWLEQKMSEGSYTVQDQRLIGNPENIKPAVNIQATLYGQKLNFKTPVMYKFTDPVKGELYEPMAIAEPVWIQSAPAIVILQNEDKNTAAELTYTLQPNIPLQGPVQFSHTMNNREMEIITDTLLHPAGKPYQIKIKVNAKDILPNSINHFNGSLANAGLYEKQFFALRKIQHDHIPDIFYNYMDAGTILKMDLKTAGSRAGYIVGAGDKVPEALREMGYQVDFLQEKDMTDENLVKYDVIISGVRAYNIHNWLSNSYRTLMKYVYNGGVLVTQYNTNNSIGPVKAKIAPYDFTISRTRVTDENAAVTFILPNHPVLNYPNKISGKDFEGWIQERSIYHAEKQDPAYEMPLSMHDAGDVPQDGSLLVAKYGKGKYVYTGLVFFRELPAAVPGAFRLFANIIAKPKP